MGKSGKPRGVARYTSNGLFVQRYPSISSAAVSMGVNPASISAACKDQYKEVAGFKWKYSSYGKLKPKTQHTKRPKMTDAQRRERMDEIIARSKL